MQATKAFRVGGGIALHNLRPEDGGGGSAPLTGRFNPGKDPVSIVKEAGWAPGQVWTGAENLVPTGDSIPGPFST
jgi:hypothetical protein